MEHPVPHPFGKILHSPPPPVLDPNRTALFVVDMQYFDAHPDWGEGRTAKEMGVAHCFDPFFTQIDAVIPRIQELLALFRRKQMEVVHLRVAEWTKDSRDVGWKQLVRGLIVPSNSKEAELLEEVAPVDDELVVSKSSSGAFPVTNLDRLLRNVGIRTLIFTGTATGGCVESAVRDAVDMGYDVIVVDDACADSTDASQELALGRMNGGLCRVWSTAQVMKAVGALADGDPQVRSGIARVQPYLPKPSEEPPPPDANPYSLIFGPAIEIPVDRADTALVLVDAIGYVADPTLGLGRTAAAAGTLDSPEVTDYYARVDSALGHMARLLEACRACGMVVLHVRTAAQLPAGRDLSPHLREQGIVIQAGSPDAEFMASVSPRSGEMIINKPGVGMFTGTGLDDLLRNMGIKTVILAGVSFLGGVEGSLRSATDRGYAAVVVEDAIAAYHPLLQGKLAGLESGIIRVKSAAEVIAELQAQVQGVTAP